MKIDVLRDLPGVIASALVGPDGLPVEASGDGGDVLAAELTALRTVLDRLGRRLGAGEVSRIALTSERVEVVAITSGDYVAGAALSRSSDTRSAQQALAKLVLDLGDLPRAGRA